VLLTSAPWRRAPGLLFRAPAAFAACALAATVLAVAASSGVLFAASAGTGALHSEAAQGCPQAAEPSVATAQDPLRLTTSVRTPVGFASGDRAVRTALRSAGLPAPDRVVTGFAAVGGVRTDVVSLFARSGARAHVHVIDSVPGNGVWVPQSFARSHRLRLGDPVVLGSSRAPVTGVFRDLAPSAFAPMFRLPRYWCTWSDALVPTLENRPPPMLLTDVATIRSASTMLDTTWYVPVSALHTTAARARHAQDATAAAVTRLHPQSSYDLGRSLPYLLSLAGHERGGVSGAVLPIEVAGTLVAALLVAGAGGYWGVRRRRELRLLAARGVGRAALGTKAVLETAPAVALGTAAGWLLAIALVRALGPSAQLEPGAPLTALGFAAAAGAAGLLAIGLLGARAVPPDRSVAPGRARRVPWELALLALSALTYRQVRHGGAVRIVHGTVQVDPLLLAFPLLALTAVLVLFARAGLAGLRRSEPLARRLPASTYLAARRLAGSPAVAIGTLIGVAIPVGVLIYSSALSGSTGAEVQRKIETNVGAQHAFGTLAERGSTPRLDGAGTVVSMIQAGPRIDGAGAVRVLGLDPATFPRYAYGGDSLARLVGELRGGGPRVRAVLVNAPAGTQARVLVIGSRRIPVQVVATRASFPGERDPFQPLLAVDRAALPPLPADTDRVEEVWTSDASAPAALAALRRDGVSASYQVSPRTFLNSTRLRPVTWIFGYLRALAYLTGLIALTALTFAFTARTRRLALSYHLTRRMGLTRTAHRRSLSIELATLLTVSWTAGSGLAVAAVALVYRLADVYPSVPPSPAFPLPAGTILVSAAVAATVAVLGAAALQRALDRLAPAALLRAP
jgi:putative ABC transport system permease protein